MIFVCLGTQDKSFKRLLEEIERLIDNKTITEEVIVQSGTTKYSSNKMKVMDLISSDDFNNYLKKATYIITHGGVGTILTALSLKKKVIAVPRLKEYKEHVNDHQKEIINTFNEEGYIIGLSSVSELEEGIKKLKTFKPKDYIPNKDNFTKFIERLIEE